MTLTVRELAAAIELLSANGQFAAVKFLSRSVLQSLEPSAPDAPVEPRTAIEVEKHETPPVSTPAPAREYSSSPDAVRMRTRRSRPKVDATPATPVPPDEQLDLFGRTSPNKCSAAFGTLTTTNYLKSSEGAPNEPNAFAVVVPGMPITERAQSIARTERPDLSPEQVTASWDAWTDNREGKRLDMGLWRGWIRREDPSKRRPPGQLEHERLRAEEDAHHETKRIERETKARRRETPKASMDATWPPSRADSRTPGIASGGFRFDVAFPLGATAPPDKAPAVA